MPQPVSWRARALDLALLLIAYSWVRWLVIDTAFDEVGLWMYELYPMGTMAELIRRGVEIPLEFYYDNAAGQIFSGLLTVPVFELLGPSYLALKVLPFLMGVGLMVAVHCLLSRLYGRGPALAGAALFVLPPVVMFKYSITCSGNHFENLFFSVLTLATFLRAHSLGITRGRLLVLGIAAGFALFIFLGALLTIAILALLHVGTRGWKQSLRDAPALLGGMLIGLAPLIALNFSTGGRGLGFLNAKFSAEGAPSPIDTAALSSRAEHYLFEKLPQAPNMIDGLGASAGFWNHWITTSLVIVYGLCLLLALPALVKLVRTLLGGAPALCARDILPLVLVLYLPVSTLAFAVSNFRIGGYSGILGYGGYRYYLPWFTFALLGCAALLGWVWSSQRSWLRAPALLAMLAVALPGLANLQLIRFDAPVRGLGLAYPGYDLPKVARALIAGRNALTREEQIGFLESFPPALRNKVVRAIGYNLGVLQIERNQGKPGAPWWIDLEELVRDWPAQDAAELARGAGIGARFQQVVRGADIATVIPGLEDTLARASPRTRELIPFFAEGLGSVNPTLPLLDQAERVTGATNGLIGQLVARQAEPELLRGVVRGQGFLCGQLWARGLEPDRRRCVERYKELFPELHVEFARGLALGMLSEEFPGPAPEFLRTEAERAAFEATLRGT